VIFVRFESPGRLTWLARRYLSDPPWYETSDPARAHAFASKFEARIVTIEFCPLGDRVVIRCVKDDPLA